MYSIIGILKKPDDWTTEQYRDWWINEHAPIAKQLPGLRRYTIHPLTDNFDAATGKLGGEPSHDGVAFLWFDDKESAEKAFASSAGQHDVDTFSKNPVSVIIFGSGESMEMLD